MSRLLEQAAKLSAARDMLRLQAEKIAQSYLRGPHGRKRAGSGETFWQFRPYAVGDVPRDIDWRQTAKRDDVFVREREQEAAQALWLFRDASASMDYASRKGLLTKKDYAEVVLLAIGFLALESGERVGVLGAVARAQSHLSALPLLQAQFDVADEKQAMAQNPGSHAVALLASDFYFDLTAVETFAAAAAARGNRLLFLQVCDPAEVAFDYAGRVRFEDAEVAASPAAVLFDDAAAVRVQYQEKFTAHRDALDAIARRSNGVLVALTTDTPLDVALARCLSVLAVEGR